jgi:hypothetical protein
MMNSLSLYDIKPVRELNCPQCGYPLPIYFLYTKLIECSICRSNIFLGDEVAKVVGTSSVLSPEPSIIQFYTPFTYKGEFFVPIGRVRYGYGRGFWEEWFLRRDDGDGWWLSIDEGDFALEREEDISTLKDFASSTFNIPNLRVGRFIDDYIISEVATGRCEGFEGELPKNIKIGLRHDYVHLSGEGGELLTVEKDESGEISLYRGRWIDPFLIKRV